MYGNKLIRRKHALAVLLGPGAFLAALALLENYFGFKGAASIGVMFWMIIWWILRPVNISVTALLPIAVNGLLDLVPMDGVVSQYFSEIIVLLFGADMICLTWSSTGLDKRIAIKVLCCIGPSIKEQIFVWLVLSTAMSVFLPNVVVCTIMVPIVVSMLRFLGEGNIRGSQLAVPLLLAIVWGAGIGGFGSPIGGAANLVAISYLEQLTGREFMYVDWLARFLPFLFCVMLLNLFFLFKLPLPTQHLAGTKSYFKEMYAKLGPIQFGEKVSLALFLTAMLLSFIRPLYAEALPALKPAYAFLVIGMLAFVLEDQNGKSLLSWQLFERGASWGMYFLFAGGLALGKLTMSTGATEKLGELISTFPLGGGLETLLAFNFISTLLSETSSNTAAAAIAVPIIQHIAEALSLEPIPYILVSIVAVNCAYILPVSVRAVPISYGLNPAVLFKNGLMLSFCNIILTTVLGYLFITFWDGFGKI